MSKLAASHLVILAGPSLIQLEVFVKDLEAIRKEFGFDKVTILGHSWGGFLEMKYALSHPEAIDKLILLNSVPASPDEFALFFQEQSRRMDPHMEKLNEIEHSAEFIAGDTKPVWISSKSFLAIIVCFPKR